MELHLDDSRPETPSIDAAISRREGVLLSLVAHVVLLLAILFLPEVPFVKQMLTAQAEEERRQAELMQAQQPKDTPTFVYVAPTLIIDVPIEFALKSVPFEEVDIEREREQRAVMVEQAGGRTSVPQIFIGGRHIGGCDDLYDLDSDGQLDKLVAA